jgi:hypothetical protein
MACAQVEDAVLIASDRRVTLLDGHTLARLPEKGRGESKGDTRGSWQPIILLVGLLAFLLIRRGGSRRCLMAGFFLSSRWWLHSANGKVRQASGCRRFVLLITR